MKDIKLSGRDKTEIHQKLLVGALNRAATLCLIYACVFSAYSVTSLTFIQEFDPSVTLFNNTWPRILFNALPLIGMYFFFRSNHGSTQLKAWIWALGLPLVFLAACLVNVWRIMAEGSGDIYLYVHSANTFILVTSVIIVAPPLRIILAQLVSFTMTLLAPIGYLLYSTGNGKLLMFSIGDYLIAVPVVAIFGNIIYRLRYKIALFDLRIKRQTKSFLGSHVADAIYENRSDLLENRRTTAVIMQMDIRSFTSFYNSHDLASVRKFMAEYHSVVSREIGIAGGYWHKSIGDAHLVSFGAMDLGPADLSDLLRNDDTSSAEETRKAFYFTQAHTAVTAIATEFERLKAKYSIHHPIRIGAAVAYGDVEVHVQGHENHKRELDIDGAVLFRCARLEEYSKVIQKELDVEYSILLVSPELESSVQSPRFAVWNVRSDNKVRDFPGIKKILFSAIVKSSVRRNVA